MSRSRPSKKDLPPPPSGSPDEYCLSCGRLLPLETRPNPTPRKYCSSSCRGHSRDLRIQPLRMQLAQTFHRLLTAQPGDKVIMCSEAQAGVKPESILAVRPAEQREEARRAARRLVNFGWESQGVPDEKRSVEAVQDGRRVEGSYAKGEWGIRWTDT